MDHNPLNALFGEAEPAPVVETPQEAPPVAQEPAEGRPRDEHGRFAAKPADEAPEAPADDAPVSEAGETQKPLDRKELHGILNATLAEREKRQAAEKERDELKACIAALEDKREDAPTVSAEDRLTAEIVRLKAEVKHGADKVQGAYEWAVQRCNEDRMFNNRAAALIQELGSPYEAAIALRKEADDLDALRAPKTPEPAPAAPAADASSPPPPRSLADAPNAGGTGRTEVPIGPGVAFNAAINR